MSDTSARKSRCSVLEGGSNRREEPTGEAIFPVARARARVRNRVRKSRENCTDRSCARGVVPRTNRTLLGFDRSRILRASLKVLL